MKRHLFKFLFVSAVSLLTVLPVHAGEQNRLLHIGSSLVENIASKCQSTWKNATTWQKKAAAISAGVILATGAGYLSYNSEGTQGAMVENLEFPDRPSLSPKLNESGSLYLDLKSTSLMWSGKRTIFVHNGNESFGKIILSENKLQYWKGDHLIAESGDRLSPYGRPYSDDESSMIIPIRMSLWDGKGDYLGDIQEFSHEDQDGNYAVSFVASDRRGIPVFRSNTNIESSMAEPLSSKQPIMKIQMSAEQNSWDISVKEGILTDRYTLTRESTKPLDASEVYAAMLIAYRAYVSDVRAHQ